MWLKRISLLLMAGGFFFIILAGGQMYQTNSSQADALKEAKKLVDSDHSSKREGKETVLGVLRLPSIDAELPVVEGTSEEDLKKGVGHYNGSSMPGEKGQMVLSGHRDTVFKKLGGLEPGDEVMMETPDGTYTYVIDRTYIVEADDRTVIKDDAAEETMTLTTCYPFSFIGDAPQRFIVDAKRKQ
ncbi:class D sortase [Bacillus massilinigeriensis]|uniref:class D sortase n=1 Tax=Bacillus mediterraneensis TaxID=1805474 RepID=UPI001F29BC64|nr:class D sortase [Bacillus mediterraneensis]